MFLYVGYNADGNQKYEGAHCSCCKSSIYVKYLLTMKFDSFFAAKSLTVSWSVCHRPKDQRGPERRGRSRRVEYGDCQGTHTAFLRHAFTCPSHDKLRMHEYKYMLAQGRCPCVSTFGLTAEMEPMPTWFTRKPAYSNPKGLTKFASIIAPTRPSAAGGNMQLKNIPSVWRHYTVTKPTRRFTRSVIALYHSRNHLSNPHSLQAM